jgi:hypothetical protein
MLRGWYNIAIVVLWLASMSWLVAAKVLPSWFVGQPPDSQQVLAAEKSEPTVGWRILLNQAELGWAVSRTVSLPDDITQVRSMVHFDRLPDEMLPELFRKYVEEFKRVKLEVRTDLDFDPLGRLSGFDIRVLLPRYGGAAAGASNPPLHMRGTIDGASLSLRTRRGENAPWEQQDLPIHRAAMLRDALSPQNRLPDLHEGQTWTMETYSPIPMISGGDPKEVLHAAVEESERIVWQDRLMEAWMVVYRSDPGSSLASDGDVRGRVWVAKGGRVLRQEMRLFNSSMVFVRAADEEAARWAAKAGITR